MSEKLKVKDFPDTSSINMQNELMVLVDDENNYVNNISISDFNSNIISADEANALTQDDNGKLFVEITSTENLDDLDTDDKSSLTAAINEVNGKIGNLELLETNDQSSAVNAINEIASTTISGANKNISNLTPEGNNKIYFWAPFSLNEVADGSTRALETIGSVNNALYYKRNVIEVSSPVYDGGKLTSGSIKTATTAVSYPEEFFIRIKTASAFTTAIFMTSQYSPWTIYINANGTMTFASKNSSAQEVGVRSTNALPTNSEIDIVMTLNGPRYFNFKYKLVTDTEYTNLFTWNEYCTGVGVFFVLHANSNIVQYIDLEHTNIPKLEWYAIIDGSSSDYDYLVDLSSASGITCKPCTITTADGNSKTFGTSTYIAASAAPGAGTYFIMKSIDTGELSFSSVYDWKFLLYSDSSYSQNTLYLDRSGSSWEVKRRIGSNWIKDEDMTKKVPLGYAGIRSSNDELSISSFFGFGLNRFAYLLNKAPVIMYSYKSSYTSAYGTRPFGYRVWSDNYFEAWGYVAATSTNYDDIQITLPGGLYATGDKFKVTLTYDVNSTTAALQGRAYGYHDISYNTFYIYLPSSTYVKGVQWEASGFEGNSSPQKFFYQV